MRARIVIPLAGLLFLTLAFAQKNDSSGQSFNDDQRQRGDRDDDDKKGDDDDDEGWDREGKKDDLVGLSLWFDNGQVRKQDGSAKTTMIIDGPRRYIQEIDITASVETSTDQGITPVTQQGDLKDLDWSGITQTDEEYRPANDGTTNLVRQRFYRKAKWMTDPSAFAILPLDQNDKVVGPTIFASAGKDDKWAFTDEGFVRRFTARQLTFGCAAVGDCSGATRYVAEGLAQFRNALRPELWARKIPDKATQLGLFWSEEPKKLRKAPIVHKKRKDVEWGYGFELKFAVVNKPQNGKYFVPNEEVQLQMSFFDGEGNRFFQPGSMPGYGQFTADNIPSGLRYYDGFRNVLQLYYALKHREGLILVNLQGPTDKLRQAPVTNPSLFDLFLPQTVFADQTADGFTSLSTLWPPALTQITNDPNPVSDTVKFVIPANAEAGTYLATFKARRDYGGETLNRVGTAEIQVGTKKVSADPTFKAGKCNNCHQGRTDFDQILHGGDDRRRCYGCHSELGFERNHALDCRVHAVHFASNRVPANVNNCTTCHFQQPLGPPRCAPGNDIKP